MKTLTEQKFDAIVKEGFYTILKPLQFKKKGNNFFYQTSELGQIINLQKSLFGNRNEISFTINIGLFLIEHWRGLYYNQGKLHPTFPTETECLIRKRIGELRKQHDTWYSVNEKTDIDKLIPEMHLNLGDFILPYFKSNQTIATVLKLLETENVFAPFGKMVFYSELGLFNKAKEEWKNLQKGKVHPDFLGTGKEYARKYNLE